MVALLEDAGGGGTSVVLGRHGGGNATVMGAFASSPSTALVTVQGDGVIMYDCEAQVRLSPLVHQRQATCRAWPASVFPNSETHTTFASPPRV